MTTNTDFIPAIWQTHTFRAMGSQITLWLETAEEVAARAAFQRIEMLFGANEQALSRFRPDSELSWLNGRCGQWTAVSPLLWTLLNKALELAQSTNGYFDPTTLQALEQAGYSQSFNREAMSVPAYITTMAATSSWRDIRLDELCQTVWLPPDRPVDFGGIAKGYTAEQAANLLRDFGPCLVDAGGDLVAGAAPTGYSGWPVAIGSPWSEGSSQATDLFTLSLAEATLATSGIDYRRWSQNGRLAHHIIDPYSGCPAETDALTVTILNRNAATAEAWATATLIRGTAGLESLLDNDLVGLVMTQDGRVLVTPEMNQQLAPVSSG